MTDEQLPSPDAYQQIPQEVIDHLRESTGLGLETDEGQRIAFMNYVLGYKEGIESGDNTEDPINIEGTPSEIIKALKPLSKRKD